MLTNICMACLCKQAEALEWRARASSLQADTDSFRKAIEAKVRKSSQPTQKRPVNTFDKRALKQGDKASKHELQLLKNKLTLCERTQARAGREWDQYEYAYKVRLTFATVWRAEIFK